MKFSKLGLAACIATFAMGSEVRADQGLDTAKGSLLALQSECAKGPWKPDDHSRAPSAYLTGMNKLYVKAYCEIKANSSAASQAMSKPNAGKPSDFFGYFASELQQNHVSLNTRLARLRAAFTIAIGVGMNESSGNPTAGAYIKDKPVEAEAGLFQLSYDSLTPHPSSAWLPKLHDHYESLPNDCLKDVFMQGQQDLHKDLVGSGAPKAFQQLMKDCPALSVEYGIVELRTRATYYGTVIGTNPHGKPNKAQFVPACYQMLQSLEATADCPH